MTAMAEGGWSSMTDRMIRAAKLDDQVYEEVEHDRSATLQAAAVVVVTSVAAGLGSVFVAGVVGLLVIPVAAILGWALYAWLTYLIGTRLLAGPETQADWGEVARTLGFANSPRFLLIFGVVPILAGIISIVVAVWVLVTTVVALRAALDFGTGRAIATAIVGWVAQAILIGGALVLLA